MEPVFDLCQQFLVVSVDQKVLITEGLKINFLQSRLVSVAGLLNLSRDRTFFYIFVI